ncbi:aminoglycoside phosphotransferase family protein [Amycolatopsis sp. WAC 01416]|uniref:phosphotransferase enzyme family protein n=1 Tax=Amycolatopsis sp. WAC 01416 TaxID=2203196 RepID=UPI000F792353|nr:aminoglycoside phosphotransferase family protein [Amycolatopsis sp. WAC 01416]RSN32214.1 aminoglycoside phosphotransferase family protein [Amycolatopsis sp. WAC 01416]
MTHANTRLTPDTAKSALLEACAATGLSAESAKLVRMGENALYYLPGKIMARIGRSLDASRKEVRIANWLTEADFPAARLAARIAQPVRAAAFHVTFWEFISETPPVPTSQDLGKVLRDLHALAPSSSLDLPKFRPLPKVSDRLRGLPSGLVSTTDIDFLWDRCALLEGEFDRLTFELPYGPIHGDAHNGNLMRDEDGAVRLIDFEDFALGPREWDVSVAATRFDAFGWMTRSEYDAYVDAYGFDPLAWPGYPTLRAIRELNMTTWLMQQIGQSSRIDREIHRRLADLRNDQFPRSWSVF